MEVMEGKSPSLSWEKTPSMKPAGHGGLTEALRGGPPRMTAPAQNRAQMAYRTPKVEGNTRAMTDDDNVIDAEIVDNLPAVIEHPNHPWRCAAHRRPRLVELLQARKALHRSQFPYRRPCKKVAIKGRQCLPVPRRRGTQSSSGTHASGERSRPDGQSSCWGSRSPPTKAVKLAAIRDALDRAGLKAPSEVVLSQGEPKAYETSSTASAGPCGESLASHRATASAGVDASPRHG